MKKAILTIAISASFVLTGCLAPSLQESIAMSTNLAEDSAKNMNVVTRGKSRYDGGEWIRMSEMHCEFLVFGLFQNKSQHNSGLVALTAGIRTFNSPKNIGDGKSLRVNIDGKELAFETSDVNTEYKDVTPSYTANLYGIGTIPSEWRSTKKYILPESAVREIAASKRFSARLSLLDNEYEDGLCSSRSLQDYSMEEVHIPQKIPYLEHYKEQTDAILAVYNKVSALNGFKKFVEMMDKTDWQSAQ